MSKSRRIWLVLGVVAAASVTAQQFSAWKPVLDDNARQALDRIQPSTLKGHVSFLASDTLAGRATPSDGLDIAAEYIASQFRAMGVEAPSKEGYYQVAPWPLTGKPVAKVRNVIGIVRGTDPMFRDTHVLVSAHYDHLGTTKEEAPDRILNGANDNGSGTAGVLEIARAISSMRAKPKRTVVFALWFGEEKGLHGSTYYADNPLFPLDKTVAVVNLEQIGRTDDVDAVRKMALALTGYDYSDMGPILRESARMMGIEVQKHRTFSDSYFAASDNLTFAKRGIPSHSLTTTFQFPDYHKVGDEWEKLDYNNMAAVLKGAALGVISLANSIEEPKWNPSNPKAEEYIAARSRRATP